MGRTAGRAGCGAMRIEMIGDKEVVNQLRRMSPEMRKAGARGVQAAAQECRTNAVRLIQEQSFGQWVKRSRQGGGTYAHVASRPGAPPNTDTGALARSVAVERVSDGVADVGTSLEYGKYLEHGTYKMEARPWLVPAANAVNLLDHIQRRANEVIGK
jgi:hypothetical protein